MLIPPEVSNSCPAANTTFSRLESWEPSMPRGLMPYCLSDSPPAWFTSNSATFTLPAPKSRHKNDFELNMFFLTTAGPKTFCPAQPPREYSTRSPRPILFSAFQSGPFRHEPSKGCLLRKSACWLLETKTPVKHKRQIS